MIFLFDCSKILFFQSGKLLIYRNGSDQLEAAFSSGGKTGKNVLIHESVTVYDAVSTEKGFAVCAALRDGGLLCADYLLTPRIGLNKRVSYRTDPINSLFLSRSAFYFTTSTEGRSRLFRLENILSDESVRETVLEFPDSISLEYVSQDGIAIFFSCRKEIYTLSRTACGKYTPLIRIASYPSPIRAFFPDVSAVSRKLLCVCDDGIYVDHTAVGPGSYSCPAPDGSLRFIHDGMLCRYADGKVQRLIPSAEIARYRTETPPGLLLGKPFPDTEPPENHAPDPNHETDELSALKAAVAACQNDVERLKRELELLRLDKVIAN
ncbi:MAG: hypothetical protein KIG36_05170 [Eubacteriales bacterium]|nr:hypothetical protein [Eubacteriales bacterium]